MNVVKKILLKHKFFSQRYQLGYFSVPYSILFLNFIFQRIFRVGSECPYSVNFKSHVVRGDKIRVGNFTGKSLAISPGCYIQAGNSIILGSNVLIGPNVSLISANHAKDKRSSWEETVPMVIGDNVWIGSSSVILPGVQLGHNVIVGAGSVVTKSFPDNVVIAGNPAKILRILETPE